MNNLEKPEIEIFHFKCDIITTSADHDNGYVDSGTLPRAIRDLVDKYF